MFSHRLPRDLTPSRLARARAAAGDPLYDLTLANPTLAGVSYPVDLLAPLGSAGSLDYRPEPLGTAAARGAVAGHYRARGVPIDSQHVAITASSSESYALAFKLLADAGDAVLLPAPSYPLLEHLARFEGLAPRHYRLERDDGFRPQPRTLALDDVRALVSVHPNNPTGSALDEAAMVAIERRCAETGTAWIVDEVFLDFPLAETQLPTTAGRDRVLTLTLGGLSKSFGLPQLKLGWIVVGGPEATAAEALSRLAFLADHYLSVATPVQLALSSLLERGAAIGEQIRCRCRRNYAALGAAVAAVAGVERLESAAGWSAVLRYPHVVDEETFAIELLERHGVSVQPGYLFDFAEPGYLVPSLLPPPPTFDRGVEILLETLGSRI